MIKKIIVRCSPISLYCISFYISSASWHKVGWRCSNTNTDLSFSVSRTTASQVKTLFSTCLSALAKLQRKPQTKAAKSGARSRKLSHDNLWFFSHHHQMGSINRDQSVDTMINNKYLHWLSRVACKLMWVPCLKERLRRHCLQTETVLHEMYCYFETCFLWQMW